MKNHQNTDAQELKGLGRLLIDTSVRDAEGAIIEQGETVSVGAETYIPRPRYVQEPIKEELIKEEPKTVFDIFMPKSMPKPIQTLAPKEEVLQENAPAQMLTPEQIAMIKGEVSIEPQTKSAGAGVSLKSTTETTVVEDKGLPMVAKVGLGLGLAAVAAVTLYYIFKPSKVKTSQKPSEKTEKELEGIRKRKAIAKEKYALQGFVK